jgi:hypothetical protein
MRRPRKLPQKLPTPALNNGRVQRAAKRALIAAGGLVSTSEVVQAAYSTTDYWTDEPLEIDDKILLATSRPPFGSWFVCPPLNRRVRKLYLPLGGRHFWSRRATIHRCQGTRLSFSVCSAMQNVVLWFGTEIWGISLGLRIAKQCRGKKDNPATR